VHPARSQGRLFPCSCSYLYCTPSCTVLCVSPHLLSSLPRLFCCITLPLSTPPLLFVGLHLSCKILMHLSAPPTLPSMYVIPVKLHIIAHSTHGSSLPSRELPSIAPASHATQLSPFFVSPHPSILRSYRLLPLPTLLSSACTAGDHNRETCCQHDRCGGFSWT